MAAPQDGWTLVTRRRRPAHFQPGPHSPPRQAKTLNPYSLSYAQVLQTNLSPASNVSPLSSPPPKATPPALTTQYIKPPHSPTSLRFPPNPHFKEWWGRCFRCARKGHIAADCNMPKFTFSSTKGTHLTGQTTTPDYRIGTTIRKLTPEPTYDELLMESEPQEPPHMPSNRASRVQCYFARDDKYFNTLKKLLHGLVIKPPSRLLGQTTLDQAASMIASSARVSPSQLQVAALSHGRLLVVLPPSLNKDQVVASIPKKLWDDGFTFHSYSPLMDASISIPAFKLWLDISGVPPELNNDACMATAVNSFGTFLGSMEPKTHGDCSSCSLFVATDDLASVPHQIDLKFGGMVYTASVEPRKWHKRLVYYHNDLPPASISYQPPPSPPDSPNTSSHNPSPPDPMWL